MTVATSQKKSDHKNKKNIITIPARSDIDITSTWDLTPLFQSHEEWKKTLKKTKTACEKFESYKNTFIEDDVYILKIFKSFFALHETVSTLNAYAVLSYYSNISDTKNQELFAIMHNAYPLFSRTFAFFDTELLSLSQKFLDSLIQNTVFSDYTQVIRSIIHKKNHILSHAEEHILAEQEEYNSGFQKSFGALVDADMKFGTITTPQGIVELSHATFKVLIEHKNRNVRCNTYKQYINVFQEHITILSTLYASHIQKDNALARIRKYNNALESSLHTNNIDPSIYHTLIKTVRKHLPIVHEYYALMKKITQLKDYSIYDTYYNPFPQPSIHLDYVQAVKLIHDALAPLGDEYTQILSHGLLSARWVDRYECKGKRSGAFSYPVYNAPPYIMMNYHPESIDNVFTLAHEGGHSMHSYFSNKNNSYAHFHYSIFEAEIASTLNEYLLYKHIFNTTQNKKSRAFYLVQHLKTFVNTFFRQTMFAEFELATHTLSDKGIPLTSDLFLNEYHKLSLDYYGPSVNISKEYAIACLRIPHFYSSFYVFQYATGIAAAHAIGKNMYEEYTQKKALHSLQKYMQFLQSAGSRFPLESLQLAGIDFKNPTTIIHAIKEFEANVQTLQSLL